MNYIITLLFDLEKYKDRFNQIKEAIPNNTKLIIYTKNQADFKSDENIQIVLLRNSILNKSIFLKIRLVKDILKYEKLGRIFIIDWFMNFNYILFLKIFLRNVYYFYAPVISNYGWFYKKIKKQVPFLDLRYDYLRFKDTLSDFLTVKFCDNLIVQSIELIDFYHKAYKKDKNKIVFSYNAYYNDNIINTKKESNNIIIKIGFVGNLEVHKGIKEMYEVFRNLDKNFVLYLAGKANGKNNQKLFEKLLSLPNVEYKGSLNKEELNKFYNEIDALILLSYHEGSPRVVREFIEYNKPIFLYDNPGVDYCKKMDGVFMYSYGEIEKIIDDIQTINYNKTYRRNLSIKENNLKTILQEAIK